MKQKTKTKPKSRIKGHKPTATSTTVFVLDRSGSMSSCKADTIGGFNEYIKTIKEGKASDKSRFTMVQFDSQGIDTLYDDAKVADVKPLTDETYQPRGGTPLYDAIGQTIHRAIQDKRKNVLFSILTDGQENQSKEYTYTALKSLMKECEEKHGWNFTFIAMGMESWAAVDSLAAGTMSANNFIKISKSAKDIRGSFARAGGQSVGYMSAVASGDTVKMSAMKANFWNKKDTQDNE